MHLVIAALDPRAPWITENRAVDMAKFAVLRDDPEQQDLRSWWTRFVQAAAGTFEAAGWRVTTPVLPRWFITSDNMDRFEADLVIVPHLHRSQFEGGRTPAMFYMQMMQRWLFTVDPGGWGPNASDYPCTDYVQGNPDSGMFDRYRERIVGGNVSKFAQAGARSRAELIAEGMIPDGSYIFFPCQIPHDESLKFFADIPEADLVRALARWCAERGVWLVLKEHPANRRSMQPLREAAAGSERAMWSEASIHDLIVGSAAVYTLNSGVGFEALLHDRPVVTFAKAEYDAITIRGRSDALDDAWSAVEAWDAITARRAYRQFVDWYVRIHAVDLTAEPEALRARCDRLVARAAEVVDKSKTQRAL